MIPLALEVPAVGLLYQSLPALLRREAVVIFAIRLVEEVRAGALLLVAAEVVFVAKLRLEAPLQRLLVEPVKSPKSKISANVVSNAGVQLRAQ